MRRLDVLFVAAAGPRLGFGHLVRCGALADALAERRRVALDAAQPARGAARRLGWRVERGWRAALAAGRPDLVVVDHPSERAMARAVGRARRAGLPVATLHDLGGGRVRGDVSIDGSLWRPAASRPVDLSGPRFAVLPPAVRRRERQTRGGAAPRVLIALGGGDAVRRLGPTLAARVRARLPEARIEISAGFAGRPVTPLPPGCRWLHAPRGLGAALARATVAVVAGGVTLYEACALGTPVVALPIVAGQVPTVRAFSRRRAVVTATRRLPHTPESLDAAADAVALLLRASARRRTLAARAAAIVDGQGTARVARRLSSLVNSARRLSDVA